MPLGEKIKQLREQCNLTQDQLANLLGVTKATISSYETGINHPPAPRLYRLAAILHTDLYYLLGADERRMIDVSDLTEPQEAAVRLIVNSYLNEKGFKEK